MRILLPFLILVGLGVALTWSSDLFRAPFEPPMASPHQLTERVGVLGASTSTGDGATPPLAAYLRATLPPDSLVLDHADPDLGHSPRARGASAVRALLLEDPTLVVALDFVFWFAHSESLARARRDSVARALSLLDHFACTVIVGDLPAPRTSGLPAEARPGPIELVALNEQIRSWAAERENVQLVRLSGSETLRTDWLQDDGFHPSAAGFTELSRRALSAAGLDEAGWVFDPARLEGASSAASTLRVEVVDERGSLLRDGELRFSVGASGLSAWREFTDPLPLVDSNPFAWDDLPAISPPGGIEVWAEVPGHIPTDRVPVLLRAGRDTSIHLVAPAPHPLEVSTFDSLTGAPVSGVLVVSLTELERRGLDPRWQTPAEVGAGARTDREGRALLRRLAPRPQRLELHRSGYRIRRAEPVEVDGRLSLPLHPLETDTRASIRVAGPNGEALEGAVVGLVVEGAEAARWARVDEHGLARFPGLPAGTALVHLPDWLALRRARGWQSASGEPSRVRAQLDRRALHLEPGSHAQATLGFLSESASGGTLKGRVRGLDGEPVARAEIVLRRWDATFGIAAVADARGEFWISGLPLGDYRLESGNTHQEIAIAAGTIHATITWLARLEGGMPGTE